MSLEELQNKRARLNKNADITQRNMEKILAETNRVADVAHNAHTILDDLDREFEEKTGLQGNDIVFLFTAIGLQLARIVIINELTKIEAAGADNKKETKLHELQEKILRKFDPGEETKESLYYASMEHIITKPGVPYDATATLTKESIEKLVGKNYDWGVDLGDLIPTEKPKLFAGANHRFATLGHDPIIGLVIGTANIMTNTITCVKSPAALGVPVITTNHVVFTTDYKHPKIATYGSTVKMLTKMVERTKKQPSAFVAALIKQIIHIGTDLYTPCGIQLPGANLIFSNSTVEKITHDGMNLSLESLFEMYPGLEKHTERIPDIFPDLENVSITVNAGDIAKIGMASSIAGLINLLISTLHMLMYDSSMGIAQEMYEVRTRKIIMYSNIIATGSNVLCTSAKILGGNSKAVRELDIGGLLVTLDRLVKDPTFIRQVKEEFVLGEFKKKIQGEPLELEVPEWENI